MKIELHEITVREITEGYKDNNISGVIGYGGKLNIRPAYQREFIYKDRQRDAVIESVMNGFPLNVMYWAKNSEGGYELIDGQQRTVSICQYVNGDFSISDRTFENLNEDEKNRIMDYRLQIYICDGTDSEKLDWFRVINTAGEKLTDQELRNATYTGEWLYDAKKNFSKPNCPAMAVSSNYINGSAIRQDYLEKAIRWISERDGLTIEGYMSKHQHDRNCNEMWLYFKSVIDWVDTIFKNYRREMKGIEWGLLYNRHKNDSYDARELEEKISKLMTDDDVTRKKGIYEYVLGEPEKSLNIRSFTENMKREAYERQGGFCSLCGNHFDIDEMEADHITPWHCGGKTVSENCQMTCVHCNRTKSGK